MTTPAGVFDVLDAAISADPSAPALVTASGTLSYASLDELADRYAGALFDLGVRTGDRVAVSLPNDAHIVALFHAAMRVGAVWVGVNQALAPPEKEYVLTDSGSSVFVGAPFGPLPDGVRIVEPEELSIAVEASSGRPPLATPSPDAPAAIAYTSGTTGFPKGAVHCQAGLILPGAATVARRGWGEELRKGDSLPLTILNMLVLTTLLTAQACGAAIITGASDVGSIVSWIASEQVTVWNAVPAQLYTMVRDGSIDEADLASLAEVWVGGADCPAELRDSFEDRFGVPVSRTYGLTEAPALVSIDDVAGSQAVASPDGASGRPLDHIRVSSIDGELCLSAVGEGPWAGRYRPLLGYWGKPAASEEALAGGVLHTGDLGSLSEDGLIRVLGRKSTVIIRGGANVYPAEIERVLATAPGVAACSVVGVPDPRLGERVGAAIECVPGLVPDEEAILAHCRESLATYKVPERFAYVERLPRNQMGKVPRAAVVSLFAGGRTASGE